MIKARQTKWQVDENNEVDNVGINPLRALRPLQEHVQTIIYCFVSHNEAVTEGDIYYPLYNIIELYYPHFECLFYDKCLFLLIVTAYFSGHERTSGIKFHLTLKNSNILYNSKPCNHLYTQVAHSQTETSTHTCMLLLMLVVLRFWMNRSKQTVQTQI